MNCQVEQVVAQNLLAVKVAVQRKSYICEPSSLTYKTVYAQQITVEIVDDADGRVIIKLQGDGERIGVGGNAQKQDYSCLDEDEVSAAQVLVTVTCVDNCHFSVISCGDGLRAFNA
jgi:hypothetical protein